MIHSKVTKYLISAILLGYFSDANATDVCDKPIPDSGYLRNFQELELGHDQWLFREHDLISEFGPNQRGYNGLRMLNNALASRGTVLVIVPLPTRGIVHPEKLRESEFSYTHAAKNYSLYLNRLRKVGLQVPELSLLTKGDQTLPLYFARDHHWTPAGAEKTAELVAQLLFQSGSLKDIPTLEFTTNKIKSDSNPGSYSRAALELCNIEYPAEAFEVYYTESEIDLFAEVAPADVVLVGTSNSNGSKVFNFDGFLRSSLGVDVMNMATSGGGFDESLLEYLSSIEFRTKPPKILIWEVPGYYSLNRPSFYEELENILGE